MKVIRKTLFLFSIISLFTACETTKTEDSEILETEEIEEVEIVKLPPEPTPEEIFIQSLENVKIEFTQFPKTANYNKAFSSSYKVLVTENETPLSNYSVTFFYPESKSETVEYGKIDVLTDENGVAEFLPSPLPFGIKDYVVAYPTPAFENPDVVDACLQKSEQAVIKVRSNIMTKGALLFIWDFNEKGKPVNNSYEFLSEIRGYGIGLAGNAPINESNLIDTPIETLYKKNYEIVEDAYGYLICGTNKFVEPVSEVEDGYKCSLISDIKIVNMKTGKVQFSKSFTHEATGKNWTQCTTKCKEELAAIVCEEIIYGL